MSLKSRVVAFFFRVLWSAMVAVGVLCPAAAYAEAAGVSLPYWGLEVNVWLGEDGTRLDSLNGALYQRRVATAEDCTGYFSDIDSLFEQRSHLREAHMALDDVSHRQSRDLSQSLFDANCARCGTQSDEAELCSPLRASFAESIDAYIHSESLRAVNDSPISKAMRRTIEAGLEDGCYDDHVRKIKLHPCGY